MTFRLHSRYFVLGIIWATCLSAGQHVFAQENARVVDHAAALAPFLSDDTFAAAYIDLAGIDPAKVLATLAPVLNLPEPDRQQTEQFAAAAKQAIDGLQTAGVRRIYLIMGIGDVQPRGGPLAVIPLADPAREDAREQIRSLARLIEGLRGERGESAVRFESHASGSLFAGSAAVVERYAIQASRPRADLVEPLARIANDGAAAAAVLAPGPDFRRVIRELWPEFPPPFAAIDRELLADRLQHVELAVKFPPDGSARLTIQAKDAESAAKLRQVITDVRPMLAQVGGPQAARMVQGVFDALNIRTEATRLVIDVATAEPQVAVLRDALSRGVAAARADGIRNVRMNSFKQLMLGMLSYESANKTLPPAAIRDRDGKPLLSWRVAILPYLGQQELYRQFRLNEPWDSPHNHALIARMPDVFVDPDPAVRRAVGVGKTTFQVPVGLQTVFYKNEGTSIREITDGTSMTIALVEVVPERAAEWTKPADWEVNLANPLDGVRRTDRQIFLAARCDGSGQVYSVQIAPEAWRGLITRAGGEVNQR